MATATQTGIVQPVVCSLSRWRSLTSCKNSFYALFKRTVYQPWERPLQLFLLKKAKKKRERKNRENSTPLLCCTPALHTQNKSSCRDSFRPLPAENNCSAPKRKAKDAMHLLLIIYPRCEVSSCCIWLHANVHWLVLVTLEADWPL